MNVGERVRRIYEKRPYPRVGGENPLRARWRLAPLDWIRAVWQPEQGLPRRILVAGCGTGAEAFSLARRFPDAHIVGVDFSPRSIAIARTVQKRDSRARQIRFVVGDLASSRFGRSAGDGFDFVSCHGVLSYLPRPDRALEHLARCLTPDGALFLGVNGARHYSVGWRRALPAFGFDIALFREGVRLRKVLTLFDAIAGHQGDEIARRGAELLSGDLFGPLNRGLALADWTHLGRRAGLHLLGSYSAHQLLRPIVNGGWWGLMMPRSRTEVYEIVEWINPTSFHRLVFSPRKPADPPWDSSEELLRWQPVRTALYSRRLPTPRGSPALRRLELKSRSTKTLLNVQMSGEEVEILRHSDGARRLHDILEPLSPSVRRSLLRCRETLYLLYMLAVINLRAPSRRGEE